MYLTIYNTIRYTIQKNQKINSQYNLRLNTMILYSHLTQHFVQFIDIYTLFIIIIFLVRIYTLIKFISETSPILIAGNVWEMRVYKREYNFIIRIQNKVNEFKLNTVRTRVTEIGNLAITWWSSPGNKWFLGTSEKFYGDWKFGNHLVRKID